MPKPDNLIARVIKSVFFDKAANQASETIKNPKNAYKLLQGVLSKSKSFKTDNGSGVFEKLQLFVRLVKAYVSGEYRNVPWKTITRIVAVLIYFLSPIDLIPDFLIGIGLTDDIALILWLFTALSDDLEAFRQWEKREKSIVIG